jgi:hypothetical protein
MFIKIFDFFDTIECGCGLMGSENCVLTPEMCLLQHGVVGEVLEVGFPRLTVFPSDATADVTGIFPLTDAGVEQVLSLVGKDGTGDCGAPQVVVGHKFQ